MKIIYSSHNSFLKRMLQLPSRFKHLERQGQTLASRFIVIRCWGHTCDICPTNTGSTQAFEQDFGQKGCDLDFRLKNICSQMSKKIDSGSLLQKTKLKMCILLEDWQKLWETEFLILGQWFSTSFISWYTYTNY